MVDPIPRNPVDGLMDHAQERRDDALLPSVSVVIPVYAEAEALPVTFPAILRAASRLGGSAEIIVVIQPSGDASRQIVEQLARETLYRIIEVTARGKFRALRAGVEAARSPWIIFVDADVVPGECAFHRILEPLRKGEADVCLPKRQVARGRSQGMISDLLERWAILWEGTRHRVRLNCPEFLWCLSGDLYAMRSELFPSTAVVPLIDDCSVGHAARRRGARFLYVPDAVVQFGAPRTYRDWLRQKIRTRRGFVRMGRLDPDMGRQQRALIRGVKQSPQGRSLLARSLVWQERVIRAFAWMLERPTRSAAETWTPVPSTKVWRGQPSCTDE